MNRKYAFFTFFLVTVFMLTAFSSKALAGWVEVSGQDGATTYISDGMVKQVPNGEGKPWSIFDANKGTIMMFMPEEMSYVEIDPEEFCEEFSKMMAGIPPEQRAAMEQMMKGKSAAKKDPSVKVTRVGDGGKIAGYDTVKYSSTVDGKPYKEIWLASGGPNMHDVKELMQSVMKMHKKMEGCTQLGGAQFAPNPELSKEYIEMMEKGWTMKEVNLQGGSVVSEVESLTKKSIPASEFAIPTDYKKIDFMEMMSQTGR